MKNILQLADEVLACDESRRDGSPLAWRLGVSAEDAAPILARAIKDVAESLAGAGCTTRACGPYCCLHKISNTQLARMRGEEGP